MVKDYAKDFLSKKNYDKFFYMIVTCNSHSKNIHN